MRDDILQHPVRITEHLKSIKEIPSEVINVILRHHEGKEGQSFLGYVNRGQLTQLECCFILAHEFVLRMYKVAFNTEKLRKEFEQMLIDYNSDNFKHLMQPFKLSVIDDFNLGD